MNNLLAEQPPNAVAPEEMVREKSAFSRLLRNPLAVGSLLVLSAIVLISLFYPMISHWTYDQPSPDLSVPPSGLHPLGTDSEGYDVLTRIALGGRVSLSVGVIVESFVLCIGVTIGLLAGYFGAAIDLLLMRVTDLTFSFPDILLAILIMAILGPGSQNVVLALSITGWPSMARLVRGQVQSIREREYIEAARAIGLPNRLIIWRHILPNVLSPIIVAATVDIAGIIIAESTLSFLGIGVKAPMPSWGSMISGPIESVEYISNPGIVVYPALFLSLTVLSLNFLGDGIRDCLDPRRR